MRFSRLLSSVCRHPVRKMIATGVLILCLASQGLAATEAAKRTAAKSSLPGYIVLPLGRGHNNRLALAATIEGKKGLMMLDTGASSTLLSTSHYGNLLKDTDRKLPAGVPKTTSMNGQQCPVVVTKDFVVSGKDLGPLATVLVPQGYIYEHAALYDKEEGRQYHGLLGEDVLRGSKAILDCARLVLYLNVEPAKQIHLGPELLKNGWTRIPMSDYGRNFTVPCVINGRRFKIAVDTGAPMTVMDRGILQGAGVSSSDLPMTAALIGMQAERVGITKPQAIQIGDFTVPSVYLVAQSGLARAMGSDGEGENKMIGLLGGDVFAKNGAIIDIGGKALYLKHTGPAKH